jgi:hypothetical protein
MTMIMGGLYCSLGREPAMSEAEQRERREHARVHVQADVEVGGPRRRVHAVLREIGRASARLIVAELPAGQGERVQLHLPGPGGAIEVPSEVERVAGAAPAFEMVVTFALVEPTRRKELDQLLRLLLAGSGGGARKSPRVARRLEVRLVSRGEQAALLTDLSRGGLGLVSADPLVVGEEVHVRVGDLVLRGRVVNQRPVTAGGLLATQAGIAFLPLDAATTAALDRLLIQLLE